MLIKNEGGTVAQRDLVADLLADKRSENTKRAYRKDLSDFIMTMTGKEASADLINQFLSLPRFEAIQAALNYKANMIERGLAEATINRRLAAVKSLVKYAKMIGACEWNLDDVSGEKVKKYRDTSGITIQQMNEMISFPDRSTVKGKRDYAILRLFWELALRREEVTKLNITDFDPETCSLSVLGKGKGTQKETMNMTERTKEAVLDCLSSRSDLKANDPLFVTLDRAYAGKRMTGESLWKLVKTIAKRAGITKPLSPHKLRHSSITAALEATNGNVVKVQKLSRHSKIDTVMIYEDHRVNQQKEVTELLAGLA
jgi:integrase/recombinase XerC